MKEIALMKKSARWTVPLTPAVSVGERIPRKQTSRFEPLNQRILHVGLANVLFPLTPALSRGERGPRRPSVDKPESSGRFQTWQTILPLPRGEGRGEGEQNEESPAPPLRGKGSVALRECRLFPALARVAATLLLFGSVALAQIQPGEV